ncbi:MAG: CoA transferase [Chloroflexi bacterium]|nr:CoA transferase [Chloroflexota bacterium]
MLSPYRVLDLADDWGDFCSRILADLGADVVKVEPPGGATGRLIGPFLDDVPHPERSLSWWAANRGKRSVTLDVTTAEGRDRVRALAAGADVFVESAAPGAMAALGLGYDDLKAINPALVYVSITPYGQDGPKAGWAATDLTVLASGGPLILTGDDDRAPVRVGVPQGFLQAAGDAAGGALLALLERARSGLGQHVDVSAQQSVAQATQSHILAGAIGEVELRRMAGGLKLGPLNVQLTWPAKEGHVSIVFLFGTAIGPFTRRLMELVYEEGFCDEATRDKDWNAYTMLLLTGAEPVSEYERVKKTVEAFTRTKSRGELFAIAQERRLLIAPVTTMRDVVESDQLKSRGYWQEVAHPEIGRNLSYPGAFAKLSATPLSPTPRAPLPGEHTAAILNEPPRRPAVSGSPTGAATGTLPLSGLKLLDFTWVMAGPAVTRVLADYGATVVRVESASRVETGRTLQPFHNGAGGPENSGLFQNLNANKLGLAIDLANPASRDVVLDLVRWADVVTESFSPRAMKAWGFDYESLRQVNPNLVMMSSCLMGQSGPLSSFAGFGNLAAAISGFFHITGWPDRGPAGPFGAYTDYVSPRLAIAALLAALDHRRRTGQGQYIDFSQAEAALHFLAPAILDYTVNGQVMGRNGNDDPAMAPHGVYPLAGADNWVAIVCPDDPQWLALCQVIGRDDLARDPGLATNEGRVARRAELDAAVSAWTSGRDPKSVEDSLQAAGVPVSRLQNSLACLADPQLQHRGHFVTLDHPIHGKTVVEGSRHRLSRTPAVVHTCAPTLGRDTFEVLGTILGYDADRIAELAAAGALE